MCVCVCVCVWVGGWVGVCVRACVCACVHAGVRVLLRLGLCSSSPRAFLSLGQKTVENCSFLFVVCNADRACRHAKQQLQVCVACNMRIPGRRHQK